MRAKRRGVQRYRAQGREQTDSRRLLEGVDGGSRDPTLPGGDAARGGG